MSSFEPPRLAEIIDAALARVGGTFTEPPPMLKACLWAGVFKLASCPPSHQTSLEITLLWKNQIKEGLFLLARVYEDETFAEKCLFPALKAFDADIKDMTAEFRAKRDGNS